MDCKHEPADWYDKNVPPDHHHPGEPWIVDRCADRCDDQLPLFSRVGRGLQGDGYFVRVHHDSDNETILEGLTYDPHTGAYTHDWFSDNINGGILSYKYKFYPYTDPKTFTITFKLDRPGYDEAYPDNPEQRGWEWTTPAIPWVWDDEATHMLGGVGTLFLKKTGAPTWQNVDISGTPNSIAEAAQMVEKLIYPEDTERTEYHAPAPGDPWTVNIEYGKGGDIDCPTTAEEQADLDALENHFHDDLYGGDYASIPDNLKPLKGDDGEASVWDWILYARDYIVFEEGVGIDITETNPDANGKRRVNIAANLEAGDGISITDHNGKKKISADPSHLHKDLYGAGTSNDHTTEIQNLNLLPLNGDEDGVANVWDWIKWAIDQAVSPVVNPEQHSQTISSYTYNGQSYPLYLCLMVPTTLSEGTAITPLAAIPASVVIEYFDVLPNVVLTIDIANDNVVNLGGSYKTYCDPKGLRIGSGEIAVICFKMGATYFPANLRTIELTFRTKNKYLSYPGSDPEILSNCGFGWLGMLENSKIQRGDPFAQTGYVEVYPNNYGLSPTFSNEVTWDDQSVHTYYYGPWQIYTGLGNIGGNDYRWVKKSNQPNAATFLYIFNRSTGNLGTRVLLDYNRAYQVDYIQRKSS